MSEEITPKQHVIISLNPNAGATDTAQVVEKTKLEIQARGFETEVITDIDEVTKRARELNSRSLIRTVVAAGGDGTLALLANRLPNDIPLTILPQGTENLFAKYYRIKADPKQIAEIVATSKTTEVDSGIANGKRFLLMSSCGFDADVVTRVHKIRTGHSSRIKWLKPIWSSIRTYKYPELQIYIDDQPEPLRVRWAFVFNFPCYAMGMKFAPLADPDDGLFDLVTFRRGSLFIGLTYFLGVFLRRHRNWRDTRFETFKKLRIESNSSVAYQLDGDPGGELPLEITVVRKSLRLLLPEHSAK